MEYESGDDADGEYDDLNQHQSACDGRDRSVDHPFELRVAIRRRQAHRHFSRKPKSD